MEATAHRRPTIQARARPRLGTPPTGASSLLSTLGRSRGRRRRDLRRRLAPDTKLVRGQGAPRPWGKPLADLAVDPVNPQHMVASAAEGGVRASLEGTQPGETRAPRRLCWCCCAGPAPPCGGPGRRGPLPLDDVLALIGAIPLRGDRRGTARGLQLVYSVLGGGGSTAAGTRPQLGPPVSTTQSWRLNAWPAYDWAQSLLHFVVEASVIGAHARERRSRWHGTAGTG